MGAALQSTIKVEEFPDVRLEVDAEDFLIDLAMEHDSVSLSIAEAEELTDALAIAIAVARSNAGVLDE